MTTAVAHDPIVKIELFPVHIPFREEIRERLQGGKGQVAMGLDVEDNWLGGDFLICRMTSESGVVGLGESFVWLVESAVSPVMLAHVIEAHLARFVLGRSAFQRGLIHERMLNNVARNEFAKGVIDLALWDMAAKIAGRPCYDLAGGAQVDRIPLSMVMPLTDLDTIRVVTALGLERGVGSFRCKLGDGKRRDIEIVETVREMIGPDAALRVDFNQAYTPAQALEIINAIAPYGIDFAEQPVRADDFAGMAWVQARTDIPLMAHEGAFGLRDIYTMAEMQAVRCFGLNAERPGGMTWGLEAIDYAAARGIDVCLHNQGAGIGSAMMIQLHAARANRIRHATELQGHIMLESTLIEERLDYENGSAAVPTGRGWGVTLNETAIDRYAVEAPIVVRA